MSETTESAVDNIVSKDIEEVVSFANCGEQINLPNVIFAVLPHLPMSDTAEDVSFAHRYFLAILDLCMMCCMRGFFYCLGLQGKKEWMMRARCGKVQRHLRVGDVVPKWGEIGGSGVPQNW